MKLDLSNITAICIDGTHLSPNRIKNYSKVIKYMQSIINFSAIKLLMVDDPGIENTEFIKIPVLHSDIEKSRFTMKNLNKYVDSDFCMTFGEFGFIVNPSKWKKEFLSYDYIGAPWPDYLGWPIENQQVGDGYFSIRSKKLLDSIKDLPCVNNNDDVTIVYEQRSFLDEKGISFAPLTLAKAFSVGQPLSPKHSIENTFGFSGQAMHNDVLTHIFGKQYTSGTEKIVDLIQMPINSILEVGSADGIDANYLACQYNIEPRNVHIVEARPDAAKKISEKYPDYVTHNVAISNYNSESSEFYVRDIGLEEGSSLRLRENDESFYAKLISVKVRTIESLANENNIEAFDLIKIDTEGCAFEAVQGLGKLLDKVKAIHIEVENVNFWKGQKRKDDVLSLFPKNFELIYSSGGDQEDLLLINQKFINNK